MGRKGVDDLWDMNLYCVLDVWTDAYCYPLTYYLLWSNLYARACVDILACTNVWLFCSNWTYATGIRRPGSLLGALIRKFWLDFYTLVLGGERKLAYSWADFEAAPILGFSTTVEAVITKFWVSHTSWVSFIVHDPTMLTHTSHNFLYALLQAYYRVEEEYRARANKVLLRSCQRLTRQQWYN
jgi:hypothetical protein